jgi:hypothetical protein
VKEFYERITANSDVIQKRKKSERWLEWTSLCLMVVMGMSGFDQVANYTFAQSAGTYTPITEGSSFFSTRTIPLISPSFSTVGMASTALSFWHYYKHANNNQGWIFYSTDGDVNWTLLQIHDNFEIGIPNIVLEKTTINVPEQALNKTNVRIKFQYDSPSQGHFWAIDNNTIKGIAQITWSPIAELFTHAAGTIHCTAGLSAPIVYAKSTTTGTKIHIATTAINPLYATNTAPVKITSNPPTAFGQTFCGNATAASLIASNNGLKWYISAIGRTALSNSNALTSGKYFASQIYNI